MLVVLITLQNWISLSPSLKSSNVLRGKKPLNKRIFILWQIMSSNTLILTKDHLAWKKTEEI